MLQTTPVYGITWADPDTPLRQIADVTQKAAETTEAALIRGGIAPPEAQDLATLAGRVTAIETKLVQAPWTLLPLLGGTGLGHDPGANQPKCQYRVEGSRVFLRGWAYTSGGVAAQGALTTALPAELRPSAFCSVWAINGSGFANVRLDLDTPGVLKTSPALAAGTYLNLSNVHWPLGV